MSDKHLSSQFDADLNLVSSKVLEMGGLVESQIVHAMQALNEFDLDIAEQVIAAEARLNQMEVDIDEECSNIIARRQPAARDLRLLIAISKTITNLERAGDEAEKIAKRTKRLMEDGASRTINIAEIKLSGEMAVSILRRALDAFARLDTVAAAQIVRDDKAIDEEFRAFVRKLISYMTGRSAFDFGGPRFSVYRQGDRADRRPREKHRRIHHLHRQGHRCAAQVARRARTRSTQLIQT